MVFHTAILLWCYRLRIILHRLLFRLFWIQVRLAYLSLSVLRWSIYPTDFVK